MFGRLLSGCAKDTRVYHWGDIDEGGFRVAAAISAAARKHCFDLMPWLMSPADVGEAIKISVKEVEAARMGKWSARAGWDAIAREVTTACVTVEQEGVHPKIPD